MFDMLVTFLAENAWNITGAIGTVIAVVDKVVDSLAKRRLKRCTVCKNPKPSCTCGHVKKIGKPT